MKAAHQPALVARVVYEITVRRAGRAIYATSTSTSTSGHASSKGRRYAQLQMAQIVAAQHPGSFITFRRVPDGAR